MLRELYNNHPEVIAVAEIIKEKKKKSIQLKGLTGSSSSILIGSICTTIPENKLIILNDKEEAAYFYNDLSGIADPENVLFFPSSFKRNLDIENPDNPAIVSRTEVLKKLSDGAGNLFIISYPEAVAEKVVTKANLESSTLTLHSGEKVSIDFITDVLFEYEFCRTEFVYEPGQYAVRGSIIDVFSYSAEHPYRIDFFGDEVESIRTFNAETQLSVNKLEKISIVPEFKGNNLKSAKISFYEFLPDYTSVWIKDLSYAVSKIDNMTASASQKYKESAEVDENLANRTLDELIINKASFLNGIKNFTIVEFGHHFALNDAIIFNFQISPQPAFNKNFDLLISNITEKISEEFKIFILSDNEKQINRIQHIFEDKGSKISFTPVLKTIHEGFIDRDLRICFYTDHQIFDRYHKFQLKSSFSAKESMAVSELQNLNPGDYIVHIDHGIGIFGGLEKIEINGRMQEAIRLVYRDNDVLYVNIHQLHRISKYKGKDGEAPKIYKLGTGAWQKLKQNTKSKVKDIAKELIDLYAKRREQKGFEYSPDTYLQEELEASFIYEDTPDQVKATRDVKKDMEKDFPMDRLICGDVGFGKTEISIRAAFKAVCDSKQVAVLVPTTILALQHYKTFSERLKNFPCNIDYISRLKTTKQIKEVLKKAEDGKVDILIGTHRIISSDVKFKNLGLLVIDEEQKFGVAAKEKLKAMKLNVDTLTMTATPIPRTLQFSLMGARDLSIINTPPPNRYPIITELHTFNEDVIREAINYETSRNGQVFFIHNRVQNIAEVQAMLAKICPEAKSIVAHGQMEGHELETIMLDFMNGDYDILIATTIIESGIDIPNANTIIINNAHNFGLSDLHQLRGRVGRTNKKAFCYLIAPPQTVMTQEARRRLKAIEDFSELGSGFNIALQDLDIRGAGNILGGEQSGFISDIGFETYHRILNEAINELKEDTYIEQLNDNKDINHTEQALPENIEFNNDCHIETDFELLIPESYIENVSERIKLYRELDNTNEEDKLAEFEKNLTDRFGPLPVQTKELLNIVRLRKAAIYAGIEKIIIKSKTMTAYFISKQESLFYRTTKFTNILSKVQQHPSLFRMRENNGRLSLTTDNISDINKAISTINKLISQ